MRSIVRHEKILKLLEENNIMPVEQLAKILNVSQMTIRRDLNTLSEKNLLNRAYGGAYLKKNFIAERSYEDKEQQMKDEKIKIAECAVSMIEPNNTVILDAGTTTMEIAKHLYTFSNITVITNDLKIALYLTYYNNINIYHLGGEISGRTKSSNDVMALDNLNKFQADIAFIGCNAFDSELGASTPSLSRAFMKAAMMSISEKAILVADRSKYNKRSMSVISDLGGFSTIITNEPFTDLDKDQHKNEGFNFIYLR